MTYVIKVLTSYRNKEGEPRQLVSYLKEQGASRYVSYTVLGGLDEAKRFDTKTEATKAKRLHFAGKSGVTIEKA